MHFEILGEISDIKTFASGSGIREIGVSAGFMGGAAGAN
jgi:hypothetical protein